MAASWLQILLRVPCVIRLVVGAPLAQVHVQCNYLAIWPGQAPVACAGVAQPFHCSVIRQGLLSHFILPRCMRTRCNRFDLEKLTVCDKCQPSYFTDCIDTHTHTHTHTHMLLDPDTSQPTANIPRMDEILHASWDQVMRKYADTPEPDVHAFAQKYDKFLIKRVQMQSTPVTGSRLAKRLRKMGVHTATGLDGWCVSDLLLLPTCLLDMLSEILFLVEATGTWPRVLARGYVSLIPKGEGMMPMQQRPLSVLSQIYRVWAGIRLEECMVWQELWIHPHAYGFRKKRGATDAAAFISMLIELHKLMKTVLHGFGLDYIKCFDLIPQSIVLHIALTQGMDLGTHRALSGMYRTLTRCFKIMGCLASFFDATNGILQGCPLSVILINLLTSVWKRVLDAQQQGIKVAVQALPPAISQRRPCNSS